MLDITQLNSFLLTPAIAGIGKPGIPSISLHDSPRPLTATNARPSVTWRVTHSCNLQCSNCLSDSRPRSYGSELITAEGLALISDLGQMGVPRLLFAGGEPLLRADILELVAYAHQRGIQPALFTNGTLLSRALATGLKRAGLHAVNILLEGTGREVDCHRGVPGTFNAILEGCENCAAAGLSAAVRIPLNRWNYHELPAILDFIESQKIKHAVFRAPCLHGPGQSPGRRSDSRPEAARPRPDPRKSGGLRSSRSGDRSVNGRKSYRRHLLLHAISVHRSSPRGSPLSAVAGVRGGHAGRGRGSCRN